MPKSLVTGHAFLDQEKNLTSHLQKPVDMMVFVLPMNNDYKIKIHKIIKNEIYWPWNRWGCSSYPLCNLHKHLY